jgi:ribose transport system substrate-binding protein
MKQFYRRRAALAAALSVPVLAAAACTTTSSPAATGNGGGGGSTATAGGSAALNMSQLCGSKPLKIAQVDGFGANSWRKTTRAEFADELSICKNVTITYAQADGDLSKYITAINSYTAQGYDAILTFDDFGSQALSALQNAHKAGVVVVPYIGNPEGKVGVDYNGYVEYGFTAEGDTMAKWLAKLIKPGKNNVLLSGGLAGGSVPTNALMDSVKSTNAQLGNPMNFLVKSPVPSGWDPAANQKAIAGVLAKYNNIDAIVSDYGVADIGALRAFVSAGRQIPLLATSATDNELGCMWLDLHKSNPGFQMITLDGTTSVVRVAALKAMAALSKVPDTLSQDVPLKVFIDTATGKLPTCRKDLPPDADLSSALSPDTLKKVFGN